MEPPHERAAGYLQMTWTPTDQAIMEHLLLEEQQQQQQTPEPPAPADTTLASPSKPPSPSSPETWRNPPPSSSSDSDKSTSSMSAKSKPGGGDGKADEDRRARHRAVQRRFVQRKKEEFQRTKRIAQELEAKYKFLRISAEERHLRYERASLEAQSAAQATVSATAPCAISASNPVDELIEKQMELVREFYEPLTADAFAAIQRSNQQEYEVSLSRDELYKSSGLTIMGWHDHRKMDDTSVKLALSKEFPNVRALDLMNRTWLSLTSPDTYGSFFSPILTIKMQVLQVLDRDAIVLHRVLYHPQTQRASNSLEMLWRAAIGSEFVIFDACLQNNAAQRCLGESYNWTQMTTTMAFSPTPADGCLLRHGGWLRHFAVSSVRYWLMEMFFMALRFESAMVSPVFALPADDRADRLEDGIECVL